MVELLAARALLQTSRHAGRVVPLDVALADRQPSAESDPVGALKGTDDVAVAAVSVRRVVLAHAVLGGGDDACGDEGWSRLLRDG